jgi:hypothetical protein
MKTKTIKTLLFCLLLFFSINTFAQQPGDTSNDVGTTLEGTGPDQAANPIDAYVLVLLFLGVVMGYLYYRKVPKWNK